MEAVLLTAKNARYLLWTVLTIQILCILPLEAVASPNVPLESDAYRSVVRLGALGLADGFFIAQKPLSQADFVQIFRAAEEKLTTAHLLNHTEKQIAEREIDRLKEQFSRAESLSQYRYGLLDPLTASFSYADIADNTFSRVDNSSGQQVHNKGTLEWSTATWFSAGDMAGVYAELKKQKIDNSSRITPHNMYLFLQLFNIRLEAGRFSQWWGAGGHGNLLLSSNTLPMETIRLSSIRPINLLGGSRTLKVTAFLSNLDNKRLHPEANLFGLRIAVKPHEILELGFSRVTMFGGAGIPKFPAIQYIKKYFSDPNQGGGFDVNELGSVDFLLHSKLMGQYFDLYGELGGEDEAGFRPTKLGYVIGFYLPVFSLLPDADIRLEYANNHVEGFPEVWYNHGIYKTGYSYKGNIIGHHMGSDASDMFLSITTAVNRSVRLGFSMDFEKHLRTYNINESKTEYIFNCKKEFSYNRTLMLNYEYEAVKNHNQTAGKKIRNHLISASLSVAY